MAYNAGMDMLGRPMRDLRISVTDRCNFRCTYCMPFDEYEWIQKKEVLSFEEIARIAEIFRGLGVTKVRLTGGEPLVRRNLSRLIRLIGEGITGGLPHLMRHSFGPENTGLAIWSV